MHWTPAYVGVGSNLGQPRQQVRAALRALGTLSDSQLILHSSLYQSRPFGPIAQPDYINAVAALLTGLTPQQLLAALRTLEVQLGREPARVRWGPRHIDLDLLVYGNLRLQSEPLTLPHPGIVQRNFVLYPLAELAPDMEVPGAGRVSALARRVDPNGIQRLDDESNNHGAR